MLNFYHIANPPTNLDHKVLKTLRNSLPIAPVCPIPPINTTWKQPTSSSNTLSSTSTGVHSKWSQPVWKLQQPETLPVKSCDTEVLASKNSASDMLTLLKTSILYLEKHGYKTPRTDKTQSPSQD